ncbi:MAG: cyclic nucleotide-binding domain-containing protein [Candidatus Omnitrophica bacterium]|nr:cyclic nucleotide-binding domain-containing protein [Candidatus Omnitrophota bacterium]
MSPTRTALLQQIPVFDGATKDTINIISELSNTVTLKEGKYFFHENDPAASFYVIDCGKVAILKNWNGFDRQIKTLKAGQCFGEMSLLDLRLRSASVKALEDCTVLEIPTSALYEVRKHNLEEFALIQANMGRIVSQKLRETSLKLFRAKMEGFLADEDLYIAV